MNCPRCKAELYENVALEEVSGFSEGVCLSCAVYLLREELRMAEARLRYWKWQAVGWGAPDLETFEVKQ